MDAQIIVQRITTTWTKASRGAAAARLRNALPKVLRLPSEVFAAPMAMHRVVFAESTGFDRSESVSRTASLAELAGRDLLLAAKDMELEVQFIRDRNNAAVASRSYCDETGAVVDRVPAFALTVGQWGQLEYNGRYVDADTGNWWYGRTVVNIGLFAGAATDRFCTSRPNARFVELAILR